MMKLRQLDESMIVTNIFKIKENKNILIAANSQAELELEINNFKSSKLNVKFD